MHIRLFKPEEDLVDVLGVHQRAVHENAADFYNEDVLKAWAPPINCSRKESFLQSTKHHMFLVAEQDAQILGFITLITQTSEIRYLYVDPNVMRQRVGSSLLEIVTTTARQAGMQKLWLRSSLNAEDFYRAHNFRTISRKVEKFSGSEVSAECVFMEKIL